MVSLQDKHHVIFDDGDEDDIDLSEEVWRLATQRDEQEALQNDGRVPVKDSDTSPGTTHAMSLPFQHCVRAVL